MGMALAEQFTVARAVFDEVDDALGEKLSTLIGEGPKDRLTLTENAQPALMAVSLAVVRTLEAEFGVRVASDAKFVAGHSLGEYSALAAAGTLSIGDCARLLRTRGRAMQEAVPVGEGAMTALLGGGVAVGETIAAAVSTPTEVCEVANDNEPAQVVLSGAKAAVDRIQTIAKEHGIRRAVPLPVSAPFHCTLMQPAADKMAEALSAVELRAPAVPVIANVTATPLNDPEEIRRRLIEQVTGRVRWRECMLAMVSNGVTSFYELGAGKVLSGLVRRIEPNASGVSAATPDDIATAAEAIKSKS